MDMNVVMFMLVVAVAIMGGYVVMQNKKKDKPAAPATPDPIVAYTPQATVPTPPNAVVVDALTPQQVLANMGGHDPKFDYANVITEPAPVVEAPAPVAAPIVVPIVAMPPPTASVAEQKAAIDLLRQQIAAFKKANGLS